MNSDDVGQWTLLASGEGERGRETFFIPLLINKFSLSQTSEFACQTIV